MRIVNDTLVAARARVATRSRIPALPCAVYRTGQVLDVETATMRPYRRLIADTGGYDLVAGIDPERGTKACYFVLSWYNTHLNRNG